MSSKKTLLIGGVLAAAFHRTVRVAEGRTPSALPPSRGRFELIPVADFKTNCPVAWEPEAHFIGLHPQEALWISFDERDEENPLAVVCGAGGINALNGEPLALALVEGGYMVVPPQRWIDGWKEGGSGNVFQFVATEYLAGSGLTVGEQILGAESKSGGIGLAVYEPKDRSLLKRVARPQTFAGGASAGSPIPMGGGFYGDEKSLVGSPGVKERLPFAEMGVGKGGLIEQKIYPDPHGIHVWKESPVGVSAVYLVSAATYAEITGRALPPSPIAAEEYKGKWFNVADGNLGDVPGSDKFTGLKTVFTGGAVAPMPEPEIEGSVV